MSEQQKETTADRLLLILGEEGLERLKASRVMVLGLGGVGSACAAALARGGVGSLVLIDRDVVTPSNINRQTVALHSTLGRPKTEVMREMVLDINPDCQVETLHDFIDKDRVAEQLGALPRPDYVVDAIDTVAQKLTVAAWCQEVGLKEVAAMGGANKLDPCRLRFAPISKTVIDPLARIVRKECRKRGIADFPVLFSDEQPIEARGKWDVIDVKGFVREGHSILGTMSYLPPIMGQMLASYVIRDLVGFETS